ncbi:MAG: HDIG domain-containing protein [Clostridiales bacterium]|jgi:putative nucleotidyltransferase with HDIG domain|nr:HDIG domain-containing protein [Clostridiales bacterium]
MPKHRRHPILDVSATLPFAAFAVTVILVLSGAYIQQGFNIEPNTVAVQRFSAPNKFLNVYATDINKAAAAEAAEKLEPVAERDTTAAEKSFEGINHFFSQVTVIRAERRLRAQAAAENEAAESEAAEQEAETGLENDVSSDTVSAGQIVGSEPPVMPIHLNDRLISLILNMDDARYAEFIDASRDVTNIIFENGLQDVDARGLLAVKAEVDKTRGSDDEKELMYEIIANYIRPNIVTNEEATQKARAERAASYDEVFYLEGQTIVDEGHVISAEAYAALEQLSLVNNKKNAFNFPLFGGAFLLVIGVFCIFFMCMAIFFKNTLKTFKEKLLFLALYILTIAFSWFSIDRLPYQISFHLVFLMLVAMMFNSRLAVVLNVFLSMITMLIVKGNMSFLIYYIFTGTYVSLTSISLNERNKIIVDGILTCAVCAASYFGVTLFFETVYGRDLVYGIICAAVMGLASVIISMGSVPFWEAVFGIVTPFRLIDLANPNSAVLRRLTIEAPGTYHHSLVVANLAETAAYHIGANPSLARAGGYYHDIGKLKYPNYFIENQAGVNPHDALDPETSAQVLKSHVSFGLELAEQSHIPPIVQEFISEHHGTTLMKYFYGKALKKAEEEAARTGAAPAQVDIAAFRYPFSVPRSRETAVVMLADTVEAAVRSSAPAQKSLDEAERIIRRLVKEKLDEDQLIDSGLTLKDIETVMRSFILVFKGMYHERIPYPETKKPRYEADEDSDVKNALKET